MTEVFKKEAHRYTTQPLLRQRRSLEKIGVQTPRGWGARSGVGTEKGFLSGGLLGTGRGEGTSGVVVKLKGRTGKKIKKGGVQELHAHA